MDAEQIFDFGQVQKFRIFSFFSQYSFKSYCIWAYNSSIMPNTWSCHQSFVKSRWILPWLFKKHARWLKKAKNQILENPDFRFLCPDKFQPIHGAIQYFMITYQNQQRNFVFFHNLTWTPNKFLILVRSRNSDFFGFPVREIAVKNFLRKYVGFVLQWYHK